MSLPVILMLGIIGLSFYSPSGVIKKRIILADSSPSAVMAAVHLGKACTNQIMNTIKITLLLVDSLL